jgi:SWIM zinc finger
LRLIEAKYLDRHALSSFTSTLSSDETQRLRRLPPDLNEWGSWSSQIHVSGIQRNRQYRGYSIHHVECSILKTADGWLIHEYGLTLENCACPDFVERKLPCKHIYAVALACNVVLPFTHTEFNAARKQGLNLVFEFPQVPF